MQTFPKKANSLLYTCLFTHTAAPNTWSPQNCLTFLYAIFLSCARNKTGKFMSPPPCRLPLCKIALVRRQFPQWSGGDWWLWASYTTHFRMSDPRLGLQANIRTFSFWFLALRWSSKILPKHGDQQYPKKLPAWFWKESQRIGSVWSGFSFTILSLVGNNPLSCWSPKQLFLMLLLKSNRCWDLNWSTKVPFHVIRAIFL